MANLHSRQQINELAKTKMRAGDFLNAKNDLLQGYQLLGPHVELLSDLAGCFFRLGDFENFKLWTAKAYSEYNRVHRKLHHKMDTQVRLKISRCLIELGMISKAIPLLSTGDRPAFDEQELMNFERIHCQLMVLFCLKKDLEKISKQYVILESLKQRKLFSEVEIQCALIQADFILVGFSSAYERLKNLIKTHKLDQNRINFIIYDFLFLSLVNQTENQIQPEVIGLLNYESADEFEQLIHDIYLHRLGLPSRTAISLHRTEGLNLLSMTRILFLLTKGNFANINLSDVQSKMMMYLNQVDSQSKAVILKSFDIQTDERPKFILKKNKLIMDDKSVSLTVLNEKLFNLFETRAEISIAEVCLEVFELPYDDSTLNRLRVLISRLNVRLRTITGIDRTFVVAHQSLICNAIVVQSA